MVGNWRICLETTFLPFNLWQWKEKLVLPSVPSRCIQKFVQCCQIHFELIIAVTYNKLNIKLQQDS